MNLSIEKQPIKNFVLLQGPIGPFFKMLSDELKNKGHNVFKINFWGGDTIFTPEGVNYTDTLDNWQKFFKNFCVKNKITDIVLFGDRRPYHEKAIEAIAQINSDTNIWVLEEGYLRPHWITIDKYGANYRSSILDSTTLDSTYQTPNETETVYEIKPWIKEAVPDILKYYFSGMISQLFMFKHFKYHRLSHPLIEMSRWIIKWALRYSKLKDDEMLLLKAKPKLKNHFILALQLETDSQIRSYSPFNSMKELMETVMYSFKNNAPENTNLIVKAHPLDEKWYSREKEFSEIAKKLEIEDRVAYIDTCNASIFLDNSLGFITANSTLSLFALEEGIPVKALGKAFWNVSGITSQKDLSDFWLNPDSPNRQMFLNLKKAIQKTQINGNFYSKIGREILIKKAADYIINEPQDTSLLTEKVIKRIKENNKARINKRTFFQPQKLDLKV